MDFSHIPLVRRRHSPERSRRRQMRRALSVVAWTEQSSGVLPSGGRRKTMVVHDREAIDLDPETARLAQRTPEDMTLGPRAGPQRLVATRASANLVRLSKFSTYGSLQVRSFYFTAGVPMCMKLTVTGAADGRTLAAAEARSALDRMAGFPTPPLLEAGGGHRHSYLVEPVVFGRHPRTHRERQEAAQTLLPMLLSAHRRAGVEDVPTSFHPETVPRLERLVSLLEWQDSWPSPERILAVPHNLATRGLTMPAGWCHGDLVFSNVIISDSGGLQLIDLEHAKVMPIASDLAKLIGACPHPMAVVDLVESIATHDDIGHRPTRHTVRDQLLISYIRELSWWERKHARASSTGRLANFVSWATGRMVLVGRLLDQGRAAIS